MNYLERLEILVQQKRLTLLLIIAPPRTGSSLLELILSKSPSIDIACHEPFLSARLNTFNPDDCYREIYKATGGDGFFKSTESRTIVVKEMSQWLAKNREHRKLFSLTNLPIIFLIRNPLLSVESRIGRVLSGIHLRANFSLQRHLLNEFAIHNGFSSWELFTEVCSEDSLSALFSDNFFQAPNSTYGEISHDLLKSLLEMKARRHNYDSWRALVSVFLNERKGLALFETMLTSNMRRARLDLVEFSKLDEQIKYADSINKDVLILDSSDVYLAPKEMLLNICEQIGIKYSSRMCKWGDNNTSFLGPQNSESEVLWYGNLSKSTEVLPPTRVPLYIDRFPVHVQQYILDINLPIFKKLSKRKSCLDGLADRAICISNFESIAKGLSTDHRQILLEAYDESESLPMRYIDPISFAINGGEIKSDPILNSLLEFYSEIKLDE